MPRVDTAPSRRAKRDAQQRSLAGLTTCSSARATTSPNTPASAESISTPVRLESARAATPPAASPMIIIPAEVQTWRHPDELFFIKEAGNTWDDMTLIRYLRANVLSILPRPVSPADPWVLVRCADGSEVTLPRRYRLPLLWVVKFLWSSIPIILDVDEWDDKRFDLLHIARLTATLIAGARAAMDGGRIDRDWRCAPFDRALRRYWHKWFVMRDEFVRDFWSEFEEEEFEGDVLKLGWGSWVLRGHKGFALTKDEVANGISAAEFMRGFVVDEQKGTFDWVDDSSESDSAEVKVDTQQPFSVPVKAQLPTPAPIPVIQSTASKKLTPPTATSSKSKSSTPVPAAQTQPQSQPQSPPVPIPSQVPSSAKSDVDIPPMPTPPIPVQFPVAVPVAKSTLAAAAETPLLRDSVSLAVLVSRIPLGGGRYRSHGTQFETAAFRSHRLSQVSDVEMREETQTTAHKRKSYTPVAQAQSQVLSLRKDSWPKEASTVSMVVDPPEQYVPPFPNAESLAAFEQSGSRPASRGADNDVVMRDALQVFEGSNVVPVNAIGDDLAAAQGQAKLGCAPYRGRPTDVFKRLLREKAASKGREQEQEIVEREAAAACLNTPVETAQKAQHSGMGMEKEEEEVASEEINTEEVKMQGIEGSVLEDSVLEDDLDLDDDLTLLYPESSPPRLRTPSHVSGGAPSPESSHPQSQCHSRSHTSSESSESRSPTSPLPLMSSAHFPSQGPSALSAPPSTNTLFTPASALASIAPSTSTVLRSASTPTSTSFQLAPPSASYRLASTSTSSSSQLTVPASTSTAFQFSPRRALAELAAEPNLLARLTQTWGELRAEVGALRAEIRAGLNKSAELEERVRRLEEGGGTASLPVSWSLQSNAAAAPRWRAHPLQHLISGDEAVRMDVDVDAPSLPAGGEIRGTKYTGAEDKEPLPPCSRKSNSAARVAVV